MIQILGIVLALSVLGNITGGWLLKGAWKKSAHLEAEVQRVMDAIGAQKDTIRTLETQRAVDQQTMRQLGVANNEARQKLNEQTAQLDVWRTRLGQRALEKPAVAERAARIGTRRWMCDVWEASGGDRDACPSTTVPSATSRARRTESGAAGGADTGRDEDVER